MKRRVVITGMGTINPLGNNVAETWERAQAGECGIGLITGFDTTDFPVKVAGEVKNHDRQILVWKSHVDNQFWIVATE